MAGSPNYCFTWAGRLLGLYSCHWRKHSKDKMPTSKCDCLWFGLLAIAFLLSLGWLYIGLILLNDLHNFNEFLFRHWGHWLDWSLVLLPMASVLLTYSTLLLFLALFLYLCGQPLHLHWLHKGLLSLTVLLVAAALVGLEIQWREEWRSLSLSLQATAPFLHIGAVVALTLLAWPVADAFYKSQSRGPKVLLLLFIAAALAIYLAPLGISSPCLMEYSHLPPKPGLVGHRGAPMLAPENTLMSLRKTAECGASVFETDVMVSRAAGHSSDFSWAELQQLNAGTWFLERQPFWGARKLSTAEQQEAKKQTVPSLKELVEVAASLNLSVMFDLRRPPPNHTYHHTFVNCTLAALLSAKAPQTMVLWLPDEERAEVQLRAPRLRQVYGYRKQNRTERPQLLNLPYQDLPLTDIKLLQRDNISVNLFVVNKPWLFSLLWCAGAASVTTNACQLLQQLPHPLWLIPPQAYLMIWIVSDCVSALLLLWIFLLQGRRARKREKAVSESAVLLSKINTRLE
ncbi:glycerophosphoinositol inositolphosphodiesterase GDPD2 isoform X3 [Petaurus breviceps papuanus]|uniref:glycerophosphoinositol inositolphosphodiesterase GDPD2 isoform X3 n=1 Tax=Petaurus breviceps papuanus TaxID=3040969 RepID=UPI0036D88EC4